MPESDFETFVRESLGEVRTSCAHMADALWDLIPRVDKLERVQGRHGRMLRDHAALLRPVNKPTTIPPPPRGIGVQTITGSWKFTDAELDAWQLKKVKEDKAAKWDLALGGAWKIALAVAGGATSLEIIRLIAGHL